MSSFLVIFILISVLIFVVYPFAGYMQMRKMKKNIHGFSFEKSTWYYETILWSWIPVFLIAILIPLSGLKLQDIGFKFIDLKNSGLSNWIIYITVGLYILFLCYNIYSFLLLRYNNKAREKAATGLPDDIRLLLPVTRKEKRIWILVAATAGITEEIVYRAYLFYALPLIFPQLSIWAVLFISTLLFGLGHIYQGSEVIKPSILGLIFGFFYIVIDSVIPIIIIHILQDMVVTDILSSDEQKQRSIDNETGLLRND